MKNGTEEEMTRIDWAALDRPGTSVGGGQSGAMDGLLITGQSGFVRGTQIAVHLGWRPVEALNVGDRALTFDHGMQTIVDIQRDSLAIPQQTLPEAQCPVVVPQGVMGNRDDMWLMPDQGLLLESDDAADTLGDPFAVVPAHALVGLMGIRRVAPDEGLNITTLAFACDEVIYIEGGMLAYCPHPRSILMETPEPDTDLYNMLDLRAARALVDNMIAEEAAAGLLCDPEEIIGVVEQRARRARPLMT